MSKKKYYAVKVGRKTGIYTTWDECKKNVNGFTGAVYKGFSILEEAEDFMGIKKSAKPEKIKKDINSIDESSKDNTKENISDEKIYYALKLEDKVALYDSLEACKEITDINSDVKCKKFKDLNKALKYLMGLDSEDILTLKNITPGTSKDMKIGYDVKPILSKAKVKTSRSFINPEEIKAEYDFIAFVDGSYDKEHCVYGSGAVVLKSNLTDYDTYYTADKDMWEIWNISGEINSVILAINKAIELGHKNIAIYHDLINLQLWACGEWKAKNKFTQEYVRFIEEVSENYNLFFIKVKAHSNESTYNDVADEAAKEAINRYLNE